MEENIELPTESSRIQLNEVIKSILGPASYNLKISKGSTIGDNYIGIVYRVVASINDHENDLNGHEKDEYKNDLSIIVKLPPQNIARRIQFFARPSFLKEIWMYDEVFPMFKEFQESRGIKPNENGFYEVAKCYRTTETEMEEAIFFEDLKVAGFEMYDRHKEVSFDHVRLVMQVLGKLHAISFAVRDQDPERFELFKSIKETFSTENKDDKLLVSMDTLMKRAKETLNETTDSDVIDRITKIFENGAMNVMLEMANGKLSEPYAVLCHGDCWNNNLLFKYDNATPVEIRLLDWQIARYASPACDLSYYIFCCTTKTFRDQYYDTLLNIYYESLSNFLKRLGSDPEKLFPFNAMLSELKRTGPFGIVMATMLLPLLISNSEDIPDLDDLSERINRGEEIDENIFQFENTEDIYKEKMRDIMLDMYKLGYL